MKKLFFAESKMKKQVLGKERMKRGEHYVLLLREMWKYQKDFQ